MVLLHVQELACRVQRSEMLPSCMSAHDAGMVTYAGSPVPRTLWNRLCTCRGFESALIYPEHVSELAIVVNYLLGLAQHEPKCFSNTQNSKSQTMCGTPPARCSRGRG